jgi:acetyl-CoA carboxylase carboxyltransferase component
MTALVTFLRTFCFNRFTSDLQVMDMAMRVGAPVIGLNDSGGARYVHATHLHCFHCVYTI